MPDEKNKVKRFFTKITYVCGSSLYEYLEHDGNNDDERVQKKVFVRENLSCLSKIELPFFSVDSYKPICIYCGAEETSRTLRTNDDYYTKCNNHEHKEDDPRRKRKTNRADDLRKKKKMKN